MGYSKDRKKVTREKIIDAAAKAFSREGLDGVSIADIMKEAGLTIGAFSWHFSSKEELIRAAIREQFQRSFLTGAKSKGLPLGDVFREYVTLEAEDACPTSTLTGEVARQPQQTRKTFNSLMAKSFKYIEDRLPEEMSRADRKASAMAILALLMGTVQISRAAKGTPVSKAILRAGLKSASKLMGQK
jgi:TetR/AcrR family transcriptional repressor of nem operon